MADCATSLQVTIWQIVLQGGNLGYYSDFRKALDTFMPTGEGLSPMRCFPQKSLALQA